MSEQQTNEATKTDTGAGTGDTPQGDQPDKKGGSIVDVITQPAETIKTPEVPAANGGEPAIAPGREETASQPAENVIQMPGPELVTGDELLETPQPQTGEPGESKDEWKCAGCGKVYDYRSLLVRHIMKGHKGDPALLATVPPQTFKRRPNLQPRQPMSTEQGAEELLKAAASDGPVDYEFMSNVLFDTSTGTLVMIFGDEWKARNEDERKMMVAGIGGYLKAKQVKDIPPGLMLTLLVTAYAAPRFRAPSTSEKIKAGWLWLKLKVGGIFKRKQP